MVGLVQATPPAVALSLRAQVHRSLPAQLKLLMKHRSGSCVCGRAPNEPDPRLTSHYLRTVRRTVVRRLLVPSALRPSSVCVLNSVPMYFMGFRTLMASATGAASFGTAASWLIASSFLSVWWQGESVCVAGGWPWSRRRAGGCPTPSRGVNWPRNECTILLRE